MTEIVYCCLILHNIIVKARTDCATLWGRVEAGENDGSGQVDVTAFDNYFAAYEAPVQDGEVTAAVDQLWGNAMNVTSIPRHNALQRDLICEFRSRSAQLIKYFFS